MGGDTDAFILFAVGLGVCVGSARYSVGHPEDSQLSIASDLCGRVPYSR